MKDLEKLKRDDLIEVIWLDASTVKNVPTGELADPDTLVKSKGRFLSIAKGKVKGIKYIILDVEEGPQGQDQTIIPLPLVVKVVRAGEREAMKSIKAMNVCRTVRYFGAEAV